MHISHFYLSLSQQIFKIEARIENGDVNFISSRKIFTIYKKLQKKGCFDFLPDQMHLFRGRVRIHHRDSSALQQCKIALRLLKKGVISGCIGHTAQVEKNAILNQIERLCFYIQSPRALVCLSKKFRLMPPEERAVIFEILKNLAWKGMSLQEMLAFMKELNDVDPVDREDLGQWLSKFVCQQGNIHVKKDLICILIRTLKFLPQSIRSIILDFDLSNIKNACSELELLDFIIESLEDHKDDLFTFLEGKLTTLSSAPLAKSYAKTISCYSHHFHLPNDHPLYWLCISIVDFTENLFHSKNPYSTYANHVYMSGKKSQFPHQINEYFGQRSEISLDFLRRNRSESVSKEQILAHAGKFYLTGDYQANLTEMERRICTLDTESKTAVHAYIQNAYIHSFTFLLKNLHDPYFYSLLELSHLPHLSHAAASFQAILHFILSSRSDRHPEEILSPKEELLLSLSASVQECRIGKEEGLIAFYYRLPLEYKFSSAEETIENPSTQLVMKTVSEHVYDYLNNMLCSESRLMKELTGSFGSISQLAHQSQYVKNVLLPSLGIPYRPVFDIYTQMLADSLVKRTQEEITGIFFSHFTIHNLIAQIQMCFSAQSDKLYTPFSDLIEKSLSLDKAWEMNEDTLECSLTKEGAFALLCQLGIIITL